MNFIQRFLFAWRYAKLPVYDRNADENSFWGEDDARTTLLFFQSHTGSKLSKLLNNFVFKTCYRSCSTVGDHAYNAGIGRGVSLSVFHLQSYFTLVPAKRDESETSEQPQSDVSMQFAA